MTHYCRYFSSCKLFLLMSVALLAVMVLQANSQTVTDSAEAKQRLEWFRQHQALEAKTPFKMPWQFVGPVRMTGRMTDVEAHHSAPVTIYIASASGGVWKTTDEAETWTPIFENYATASIGDIALAPSNPDIVWIGTGEANILRSSMAGTGVYKSTDGGGTFKYMGLSFRGSDDRGKTWNSLRGTHVDYHGMWINPTASTHLLVVNDGGLMISHDKFATHKHPTSLPIAHLYNVGVSMAKEKFWIYSSAQDTGAWRGEVDLTQGRNNIPRKPWEGAPGDESGRHAVDPINPNILYSVSRYGGGPTRTDYTNATEGSRPRGVSVAPDFGEDRKRAQWVSPIIISPHSNERLLYGAQFVFVTNNMGEDWRRISPDLTNYDPAKQGNIAYSIVFSIAESPLEKGLIYAGTDDGNVQVTHDEGKTWTKVVKDLPADHCIAGIEASRFDETTVYIAVHGKRLDDFNCYVFKSSDYGLTWTNIANNIPGSIANVVKEDPTNKNILYVGTDRGVYVTINGGKSWTILGRNLPTVYVHDFVVHTNEHVGVIATHGRGCWVIDLLPVREAAK